MRKNIMIKYPSSEYMFVGDTNGDYKAALEAEIPFVYAKYGYGNNSCVAVSYTHLTLPTNREV